MPKENSEIKVIKFSILWIFIAIVIIALILAFFKSNIFATNEPEKEKIIAFEKNEKAVNLIEIMVENTNQNKKLVNEEREVPFSTEYEDNPNLPKDENQEKQAGKIGKIQVTALQEYENDNMIKEEIIETITLEEAIPNIIYVGTSEFLNKYKVHIGDNLYLLEAEDLKEEQNIESNTICKIPRHLNVELKEAGEEWVKVKYKENEGYLKTTNITSESMTPLITEKNRVATLKNNLNIDMDLSLPSKLTLSDYKTIFANNLSDKNKIFEQNSEIFYKMEQKYKINGVLIAAIGIHESAWGTSTIAINKKNLFGFSAYDRDPYNSATSFETYEQAIEKVAEALSVNYLHTSGTEIKDGIIAKGTYYNGTDLKAINTRYASDMSWSEKVFKYMQYLYNKL